MVDSWAVTRVSHGSVRVASHVRAQTPEKADSGKTVLVATREDMKLMKLGKYADGLKFCRASLVGVDPVGVRNHGRVCFYYLLVCLFFSFIYLFHEAYTTRGSSLGYSPQPQPAWIVPEACRETSRENRHLPLSPGSRRVALFPVRHPLAPWKDLKPGLVLF